MIQFLYGEDGMDALNIEFQNLESIKLSDKDMESKFAFNFTHPTLGLPESAADPKMIEEVKLDARAQEILEEEYKQVLLDRQTLRKEIFPRGDEERRPLPINTRRLILSCQKQFGVDGTTSTSLRPDEVVKRVRFLLISYS